LTHYKQGLHEYAGLLENEFQQCFQVRHKHWNARGCV